MGDPIGLAYWDYYIHNIDSHIQVTTDNGTRTQIELSTILNHYPFESYVPLADETVSEPEWVLSIQNYPAQFNTIFPNATIEEYYTSATLTQLSNERGCNGTQVTKRPFPSQQKMFDVVLAIKRAFPINSVNNTIEFLEECRRVLTDSGKIVVGFYLSEIDSSHTVQVQYKYKEETLSNTYLNMTQVDFTQLIEQAGLKVDAVYNDKTQTIAILSKL